MLNKSSLRLVAPLEIAMVERVRNGHLRDHEGVRDASPSRTVYVHPNGPATKAAATVSMDHENLQIESMLLAFG